MPQNIIDKSKDDKNGLSPATPRDGRDRRRPPRRSSEDEPLGFHDDGSGEVVLAEIPRLLPREVLPLREWEDRARLAAHISRAFFTISQRTLETWPVRTISLNKRTLLNTAEALDYARAILAEAVAETVMGGSGGSPKAA
jgi:hypothetical protein